MNDDEKRLLDKIRFLNTINDDIPAADDYFELIDLLFAVKRYFIPNTADGSIPMAHNTQGYSALPIFTDKRLLRSLFPKSESLLYMVDVEKLIFDYIAEIPDLVIVINPNNDDKMSAIDLKARVFVDWKKRHLRNT